MPEVVGRVTQPSHNNGRRWSLAALAAGLLFGVANDRATAQSARSGLVDSEAEASSADELLASIESDGRLDARELDTLVNALAQRDPRVAAWLASFGDGSGLPSAPPEWLASPSCDWSLANPLLLHAARAAAIDERHEAALEWLAIRKAKENRPPEPTPVDGAAIALYYEAVASHQLVRLSDATAAAEALLALPITETAERHRRLAQLVLRDARDVDEASLGFVSRLMGDSRRRLTLGRSGEAEQRLQQDIVDRLDKAIDELESQQQQQKKQQANASAPPGASKPMDESRPAELKGAGDIERREAPQGDDWGSLPPAERERVTQQIIRDFPGHYRSLIEEYFRSLADPAREDPAEEAADR